MVENTAAKNVTVITGGAGGMGLATAKIMGKDHHVVIVDINQERLENAVQELEGLGISCTSVVCDITDRASVDALVKRSSELGKVSSVIHTAGISPQMGNAEIILKVNALGTININESFYQIADEGFAMVNVASMAAHLAPRWLMPVRAYEKAVSEPDVFMKKTLSRSGMVPKDHRAGMAYSISKNFVMWYSREYAGKFGKKGARILSVSPGSFDTEMGRLEEKSGSAEMLEYAALKRFGKPEEIAELLAFTASEKAGYLTATDIICDGGVVAGRVKF